MSEPTSKFDNFGLDQNPFDTRIADEEIASRYKLVGRDEQEHQLREFVESGIRSPTPMKRRLIFGEYGTGKSHHLITLRDRIDSGVEIEDTEYDAIAIYIGNLGLSIKRLYEKILEEFERFAPGMGEEIEGLDDVEPEASVDEAYQFERLQDNITENIRRLANAAREEYGYQGVFLFIDEAEDIANEDEETVQPFIRAFLHLVNNLNAAGIHILLGFSQGARMRITSYEDDEDTLGNALVQRFQGGEIYLGDLTTSDVKEMLIDRMDMHRTTGAGDIAPIVEDTVDVVTEVTGGHPREVLAVYSEALDYAEELGRERIDGEAVVHALTGFDSFTRDEELLGSQELTALQQALDDAHPDARDDFDRLRGRLIGEGEAVPEDTFSDGVPGSLLNPLTVDGSDDEIRVLEQRDQHGQYSYVLSEAARDFLFGSGGGGGTRIQQLDLQASSAPEKYQRDLSRGLGIALQDDGYGSLHRSPVTERRDRHEFGLHPISIKRDAGKNNQNVALGVYNGQEIPEEIVRLYVEAISDGTADFGVLTKENQPLSAEGNRYLNELDDVTRGYFEDRVIEINLTTDERDDFIYGRLLALGDTDTDADEDVDTSRIVEELDVTSQLTETFDDSILPYPEETYRKIVDHLRGESTRDFTIGGLREELDLEQYELNGDIMAGLRSQSLVAKDGQRWTYPDLESDQPPWYHLYRHLNEDGPLTMPELKERVTREYVLDCSSGDETAMFQWYLEQLQIQDYVERTEVARDGEPDAYKVVSVTDQFNQARNTASSRLDSAEGLLEEAEEIGVDDTHSLQNAFADLEARLQDLEDVWEPDHSDLEDANVLIEDITALEEDLEESISDRESTIEGEASDLVNIKIADLRDEIEDEGDDGSFAQRLADLDGELSQYGEELNNLIKSDDYKRLSERTDAIRQDIERISDEVGEILEAKGQCARVYEDVRSTKRDAEATVEEISRENSIRDELLGDLDDVDDLFEDYNEHFRRDDYDQALAVLEEQAKPLANDVQNRASSTVSDQDNYSSRLDRLERDVTSIEGAELQSEAQEILDDTREDVATGDFGRVPAQISEIEELLEGPTQEELFEQALRNHDGSLSAVIENEDFDVREAFGLLKRFYRDSDSPVPVDDVRAVMSDE